MFSRVGVIRYWYLHSFISGRHDPIPPFLDGDWTLITLLPFDLLAFGVDMLPWMFCNCKMNQISLQKWVSRPFIA